MPNLFLHWRALAAGLLLSQTVTATDWISVDDFDSHNANSDLDKTMNWQAVSGFESAKVVELSTGNHVAQIGPGESLASNINSQKLAVPEGAAGVIFLKFRALEDSRYWGGVFGMASRAATSEADINAAWTLGNPSQGARPNATFAIVGEGKDEILVKNRGRMNRAYENDPEIEPGVWYNLWVTFDNSNDEISMYIQGGKFAKRTQLTDFRKGEKSSFQFQTASASNLTHFVIINPTDREQHNPRTIQVDEINYFVQQGPSAVAVGH